MLEQTEHQVVKVQDQLLVEQVVQIQVEAVEVQVMAELQVLNQEIEVELEVLE